MPAKIKNPKLKIAIVGAGPAGTSAAIRLALDGFSVTLIERERFPRQKLCGEFISPECFRHFRALGVFDEMIRAGGDRIAETIFYAPNGKSVGVPSKWFDKAGETALGLSRAEMDFQLLNRARSIGVEVLEEAQVIGLLVENERVCGIKARDAAGKFLEIFADLTIDASGRARVLGKLAERDFQRQAAKLPGDKAERTPNTKSKFQTRLVGLKAHLKNAAIEKGRCEIYFFRGGYGGLNYVENNLSNHCFLVQAQIVKEFNSDARQILEKVIFQNRRAAETLKTAEPVHDWLAVAVDGFGLKNLNPARGLIAIGDAGAFIDPFTGSGMLMALESGELAARCAAENSSVEEIAANYRVLHRDEFQKRLRVCSLLRRAAFAPHLAGLAISLLNFGGNLPRRFLARATRPRFSTPGK